MTYKGQTYQSIQDILMLKIAVETQIQALKSKQKVMRITNTSVEDLVAIDVSINAYTNYHDEIKQLLESLVEKINIIAEQTEDLTTQVFIQRFINGYTNDTIMKKLNLSERMYYFQVKKIDDLLESTDLGKEVIKQLEA